MLNKTRVIALIKLTLDLHPDAEIEVYPSIRTQERWFVDIRQPSEDAGRLFDTSSYGCEYKDGVAVVYDANDRNISQFTIL